MQQFELRDTDPLCKHDKIGVGCGECANERANAFAAQEEEARRREEEKQKDKK